MKLTIHLHYYMWSYTSSPTHAFIAHIGNW